MSRRTSLHISTANPGPLIVKTNFNSYDVCLNSFVGCEFACRYCYVRSFNFDKQRDWWEFVRIREHMEERLPKELSKGYFKIQTGKQPKMKDGQPIIKNGKQIKETIYKVVQQQDARLVLGTLTDPWQPLERKYRITRAALKAIIAASPQLNKVGVFTRSPIVLEDLDLILQLPRKRVHYTVTPYTPEILHLIEPIAIQTERRWDTIRKLKAAGVRVHVNVAPSLPIVSEQFTDEYCKMMADIRVEQFFTDPMQCYSESYEAVKSCLKDHPSWPKIDEIISNKEAYAGWKETYKQQWFEAWAKVRHLSPNTMPIFADHEHHVWLNMNTNEQMDRRRYGDDLDEK